MILPLNRSRSVRVPSLLILTALLAAGCAASTPPAAAPPLPRNEPFASQSGCSRYAAPTQLATTPPVLIEWSGVVASARHPGMFWAHNDSGNEFELFLISSDGTIHARHEIGGPSPKDVEAITQLPCDDGQTPCLVLGDIGDNLRWRREYQLYRFPEPASTAGEKIDPEVMTFTLPETPLNFEALFGDPRTGKLYLVTKRKDAMGEIFGIGRFDAAARPVARQLRRLAHPSDRLVTAADLHPSGERLLLRTYLAAYELRATGAEDVDALIERGELVEIPSGAQPQGEAIAYEADGRSYLMGSEQVGAPILRVGCD